MIEKKILNPDRVRKVPLSFSWVDHRILRDGHLEWLSPDEMLLYFFLVLVSDPMGLSFYSTSTLSTHLKISASAIRAARAALVREGLIAFKRPLYQVLSLPVPVKRAPPARTARGDAGPVPLASLFSDLEKETPHEP